MTRLTVATEGEINNNCMILPGAMHCEDDEIPVNWQGDHNLIIGKAAGFQREGDKITMEVEIFDDVDPYLKTDLKTNFMAYTYVSPFEAKEHPLVKNAISEVSKARIRAICLDNL